MTIQIRELVVKASVTESSNSSKEGASSDAPANSGSGSQQSIIACCVDQVLKIIEQSKER